MFGSNFGVWEILAIAVVILLLFGAKRLPEMGRSVGRGMREFKDAVTSDKDDDRDDVRSTPPQELEPADSQGEPTDEHAEPVERETVR